MNSSTAPSTILQYPDPDTNGFVAALTEAYWDHFAVERRQVEELLCHHAVFIDFTHVLLHQWVSNSSSMLKLMSFEAA